MKNVIKVRWVNGEYGTSTYKWLCDNVGHGKWYIANDYDDKEVVIVIVSENEEVSGITKLVWGR